MKKLILGLAALIALTFVACDESEDPTLFTIDFEDVALNDAGLNQNDSISGSMVSGEASFTTTWTTSEWGSFNSGFTISNQSDTITGDYTNAFSCFAGTGAEGSSNYAVYYSSNDSIKFNSPVDMESVMLCNNTYAALSMTNGDWSAKKFEDGDYFKLILSIYDESHTLLGDAEFYLADFRDGASLIVNEWTALDLSTFEDVSYIKFSFESTDNGDWGINTPTYFCIDNIKYY